MLAVLQGLSSEGGKLFLVGKTFTFVSPSLKMLPMSNLELLLLPYNHAFFWHFATACWLVVQCTCVPKYSEASLTLFHWINSLCKCGED